MEIVIAILAFGLLVVVHELGHFVTAKLSGVRVIDFSIGLGPKLVQLNKKGGTTFTLRVLPIGGACLMEGEDEESDDEGAFNKKPRWKRFIVLAAGSLMNFILGFAIIFGLTLPNKTYTEPVITKLADYAAESGIDVLQPGDRLLMINGERIYTAGDIGLLLTRYKGDPYTLVVRRDGEKLTLTEIALNPVEVQEGGETVRKYGMTFLSRPHTFRTRVTDAVCTSADYVRMVRMSLADLFTGRVGVKDLSGPVGITSVMTEAAAARDYMTFMLLLAFISINLSVMNLLPLPALDGGRLLFLLIEALLALFGRRPLAAKYEAYIHFGGFALLMALILYVTVNDIIRLVS